MSSTPSPSQSFVAVTYSISVAAIVTFTLIAVFLTRKYLRQIETSLEDFITARGTQGAHRIAWSFFAGAVGAWAIASPAQIAVYNGFLGLVAYSISAGIPILIVAFFGARIQTKLPHALSLSDFALWRYGRITQVFVALLCIFNMAIALLSEYSVIGSIFRDFLGSTQYPIIVIVGIFTMAYTAYGGLLISIITDQFQGMFAVVLTIVLLIYVALDFRPPGGLPQLPESLGPSNTFGQQSFFSLPISLIAATIFSEANWQRVWAASDQKNLRIGATVATILITVVVFFFGFLGLLSSWANMIPVDADGNFVNPNLFLFQVFGENMYGSIGGVTVLLTTVMNQGAVDTLQNALAATVASNLFRNNGLWTVRLIVVVVNIPIMILGFLGLPALNLFLIANILTSACFVPVVIGMFDLERKWISGYSVLFACLGGILSICGYGLIVKEGNWAVGLIYAWWSNNYDALVFLTALVGSTAFLLIWVVPAKILNVWFGINGQQITDEMLSVTRKVTKSSSHDRLTEKEDAGEHDEAVRTLPGGYESPNKKKENNRQMERQFQTQ
ncbi:hypothetical protein BKA69DRAFT_1025752 [Paraphysoderma sedebokerense]|nr:hypothetical protein BKA69DRAFT_1025752 [Paraphysoderma sedebokerense]